VGDEEAAIKAFWVANESDLVEEAVAWLRNRRRSEIPTARIP